MKKPVLIYLLLVLLFSSIACGLFSQSSEKIDELATKVAEAQEEILPSLEAQLTEVAPTIAAKITDIAPTMKSQMEELPDSLTDVKGSIIDFTGAPEKIITDIQERMKTLKSYREKVKTYSDDQLTGDMDFEVQMPDRLRATVISDDTETEIIMIDKTFYINLGDSWIQVNAPMNFEQYMLAYQETPQNMRDYKLLGPDNLDGRPTIAFLYTYTYEEVDFTAKVWVGLLDGYIYRTEVESVVDKKQIRTEIDLFDFDEEIKIEAPVR